MQTTQSTKAGERTQFAPGPWSVDAETPNHRPIIIANDGEGRDLAEVLGDGKEERAATARLMGAAPELLELLRDLCDAIWDGPLEEQGAETFTDPARALIAKVEGK